MLIIIITRSNLTARSVFVLRSGLLVHVSSSLHQNRKYFMVRVQHSDRKGVSAITSTAGWVCPLQMKATVNHQPTQRQAPFWMKWLAPDPGAAGWC